MTIRFHFTSRTSGQYLGAYSGLTVEQAHNALCREAGYDGAKAAAKSLKTTVEAMLADLHVEVGCACGGWSGIPCDERGFRDAVNVEFMPEHLRASHEAAGSRGQYPYNGAERILCAPICAKKILSTDGEWAHDAARNSAYKGWL